MAPFSVMLFFMHCKCYLNFVVVQGGTPYNKFISFRLLYKILCKKPESEK